MPNDKTVMTLNDLPITRDDEDRLNFKPFANKVALGIKNYSQDECFVISVEGQWGIGKTSFVNLVTNEIKDDVELLRFNPWLISNIEQLISVFFTDLTKSIVRISVEAKWKLDIAKDMKKFASAILPDQVSVGITEGTKATWKFDKYFKGKDPETAHTLHEQKENINNYLRKPKKRIVVIIDDIDRLMDKEIELVFRLIKGIADFDNITYILLFDKEIVSNSLDKVTSGNGQRYLEKIIQYPLLVPKPHEITIVKLLTDKLDIYLNDIGNTQDRDIIFVDDRWELVHAQLGKYIKTVRDVNRLIDIFSFEYTSVCEDVNFIDFFVITLIRLHEEKLYRLIENRPEMFILGLSYELLDIDFEDKEKGQQELIGLIKEKYPSFDKYEKLMEVLFPIFDKYNPRDIRGEHQLKRIADRYYFDTYFSLSMSSDKLSYLQYSTMLSKLISEPKDFANEMAGLDDSRRVQFTAILSDKNLDVDNLITIAKNLLSVMKDLDKRDFRNDDSYCDNRPAEWLWIELIAEIIVKQDQPDKAFVIFEDSHIEVRYKCFLNQYLQKKLKAKNKTQDIDELVRLQEKDLESISSMSIDKFLSYEFLDLLSLCFSWNEIEPNALKVEFEKEFFKSKATFFLLLEKYIYKQVNMPRKEYPYSINKTALAVMVDLEKVRLYIENIEKYTLSENEQMLLKYWDNERDLN